MEYQPENWPSPPPEHPDTYRTGAWQDRRHYAWHPLNHLAEFGPYWANDVYYETGMIPDQHNIIEKAHGHATWTVDEFLSLAAAFAPWDHSALEREPQLPKVYPSMDVKDYAFCADPAAERRRPRTPQGELAVAVIEAARADVLQFEDVELMIEAADWFTDGATDEHSYTQFVAHTNWEPTWFVHGIGTEWVEAALGEADATMVPEPVWKMLRAADRARLIAAQWSPPCADAREEIQVSRDAERLTGVKRSGTVRPPPPPRQPAQRRISTDSC